MQFNPEQEEVIRQLTQLLKQFKYKSGWQFTVERFPQPRLLIRVEAIDADAPDKTILVTFAYALPLYVYESFDWPRWLRGQIIDVEIHEVDEFFILKGQKPYYPH